MRRHGLVSFYALAYGMSWLFWLPYVLSQNGLGVLDVSFPEILGDTQLAGILPGAYLGPSGEGYARLALVPTEEECERAVAVLGAVL